MTISRPSGRAGAIPVPAGAAPRLPVADPDPLLTIAVPARARSLPARRAPLLVLAAVALAAFSLLWPWALAFDPQAWLVWGRDTLRLALDTSPGPSWKPLPVVFTTPFALVPGAAPALWMIVARAGGLLALAGTWALAERLAGRWAGFAAAATMALSPWWLFNTALGNSEGLLAAAVVWAVVEHLEGHRRTALVLGTLAALLRPEVWPFLGLYGIWLWIRDPAARGALAACAIVVLLLWFGPDAIGAGGALGASKAARGTPSPGSAGLDSVPALALLIDTIELLTWPALAAGALAAILGPRALRRARRDAADPIAGVPGLAARDSASARGRTIRVLAAGAAAWVAIVAAMTQAGYAGNPRYLVAAAAIGSALAGVGAVSLSRAARAGAPFGAAVLLAAVLAVSFVTLRDQSGQLSTRPRAATSLAHVIAAAGGRDGLLRCGPLRSALAARSLVSWQLDVPMLDLGSPLAATGVLIRAGSFYGGAFEPALPPGSHVLAEDFHWQVVSIGCGP